MTAKEAIRQALSDRNTTQTKLAELLGYASSTGVSNKLNSTTQELSVDTVIRMLDVLDYEVVVQPKTSGKRKEGSIVLEASSPVSSRNTVRKKEG